MILYVTRHGQATWNVLNKICGGRSDVPLTDLGRSQAQALARTMPPIDRALVSPLQRAQETAAILTGGRIPIKTEPRLREQDFGEYEGMDRGTESFLRAKKEPACRFPGGESSFQTAARVYSLLDELKAEKSGDTVLLVCHGAVMRIIETYFRDMPMDEFYRYSPENCKLVRYEL